MPAIADTSMKGRPIVGAGPQSTGGNIRAGKKVSNETKCGEKKLGCDVQSGQCRKDRSLEGTLDTSALSLSAYQCFYKVKS